MDSLQPNEREIFKQLILEQEIKLKLEKIERFRKLNPFVVENQILFVGSSLMEQFPINEFLLDFHLSYTIYNRGVGGFTTNELLSNMHECIFDLKPKYIFINIGTNDMNDPQYDVETLILNYTEILRQIQANLPHAKIYLLAYYPINAEAGENHPIMKHLLKVRTNQRINEANHRFEKLAKNMNLTYLDLNKNIMDENGNLKAEYTIEGMHMYANGYKMILDELLPILENL